MKTIGIVRKIDRLGRFVLPVELRKTLGLALGDTLEIFVEEDRIVLERYVPRCIFCGGTDRIASYRDKNVCLGCAGELGNAKETG